MPYMLLTELYWTHNISLIKQFETFSRLRQGFVKPTWSWVTFLVSLYCLIVWPSLNVYNVHKRFVLSVIGIEERGRACVHVYVEYETCARGGGQAWIHDGPEPTLGIKEGETERERERERERCGWYAESESRRGRLRPPALSSLQTEGSALCSVDTGINVPLYSPSTSDTHFSAGHTHTLLPFLPHASNTSKHEERPDSVNWQIC